MKGDTDSAEELAKKVLEAGIDPLEAVEKALLAGVLEVGDIWINGELFIIDLVMAADAMKAALSVLKPEIVKRGGKIKTKGRVVIGTVEGDIHDVGKTLVTTMLEASGFEVIDLGVDVPVEKFIEAIKEYKPDIVGMSALLTTTMEVQKKVIEALEKAGLRDKVKVIVGGAPTTEEWAKKIGADGWAPDAVKAVKLVKNYLKQAVSLG